MSTTVVAPVRELEKLTLVNDDEPPKFPITREQTLETLKVHVNMAKPGLKCMYKTDEALEPEADKAMRLAEMIWDNGKGCSPEIAREMQVLVLYDLVMLIDDSSSMHYDQGGKRKEILEKTLKAIASVYTHARPEGLKAVRFLNSNTGKRNVRKGHVRGIFKNHSWRGATRIGTQLERKILNDFVYTDLKRPVLVMVITDGAIEGEEDGLLKKVIISCTTALKDSLGECGSDNVAFQFSRVGDDRGAADLLTKLDNDPEIGDNVDCLPIDDQNNLDNLNSDDVGLKWNLIGKLLLGAIHPEWDDDDDSPLIKDNISVTDEGDEGMREPQGVYDEDCGEEEEEEEEEDE